MTLVREFNLYLNAGKSIPLVINANQYDQGEQWVFTLYTDSGVQYTPSSGAIVGIKSDNLGIINTGTVDGQGRVVINETQQMTAAAGKAVFELMIDSQTHGTANFVVLVEKKPGDNADLSESDLSLIQQAIDSTSPTVIAESVSDWLDEHITNPTNPAIDTSLSVAGAAADAKATGDAIAAIEQGGGDGLTADIKQALLQIAQKVAYIDANGQDYYDDLYDALYPPVVYTAITLNKSSLSFGTLNSTQQLTATTTPSGGAVTWTSSNTSVATVSQTGVVTSVAYGNATITATCGSLSANCSVAITQATLSSISAVYTQSGAVYDTDSLDSLKSDLVVTATWSNQTTSTVASADYTLSGTLTEGTSVITVSYGGKTTTFNVTVTASLSYNGLYTPTTVAQGYYIDDTGAIQSATENSGYYEDYIDVTGLESLHITYESNDSPTSANLNYRVTFYDSSKTFTRQVQFKASSYKLFKNVSVAFESGEAYIRLGWYSLASSDLSTIKFYLYSPTATLPMTVGDIDATTGLDNDGNLKRIRTTGYIPTSDTVTFYGCPFAYSWYDYSVAGSSPSGGYAFRCYDSNYNYLGGVTNSGSLFNKDVTEQSLPSATAYIRIIMQKSSSYQYASGWGADAKYAIGINGTYYMVTEV